MLDNDDRPVLDGPIIDRVLRDPTGHAGHDIAADGGEPDLTFCTHPHLVLAGVEAAARYTAAEFRLQMPSHPIPLLRLIDDAGTTLALRPCRIWTGHAWLPPSDRPQAERW